MRTVRLRAGDRNLHAGLESADNQRIAHIVSVTDVAQLESLELRIGLTDGHEIRQHLTRVGEIRHTADDRNRTAVGKPFELFLLVGAEHDAVQIAGQRARRVLHRFAAVGLHIAAGEEHRPSAQLVHTGLKRNTGAGGQLLEDQSKALALQMAVRNVVFVLILQLVCHVEQVDNLLARTVQQL